MKQLGDKIGAVIVSTLAVAMFGAVIVLWVTKPPAQESAVLNVLVGALAAGFGQVLNYWLGSSAGSSRKDETISAIARGPE